MRFATEISLPGNHQADSGSLGGTVERAWPPLVGLRRPSWRTGCDNRGHHPLISSTGREQIADADQVVGRRSERKHPADSIDSAVAQLVQKADRLLPAEDLFHALARPLTDGVPGVPGRAPIDRTPPVRLVLRHMWRDSRCP